MVVIAVLVTAVGGIVYALTANRDVIRIDIPTDVGISGSCIRPIHTHDGSGTIHVETDENRDYTLGDFFLIWGKNLTSAGIFSSTAPLPTYLDRCLSSSTTLLYHSHPQLEIYLRKDAPATVSMTVNGNAEPRLQNYVVPRNTDTSPAKIVITYGPGVTANF